MAGRKINVSGTAIRSGVSKNGIMYTKEQLQKTAMELADKPLLKDHKAEVDNTIGRTTASVFNTTIEGVDYKGWAKEDGTGVLEKLEDGRITEVSIGAVVDEMVKESEDSPYKIAQGIHYLELSLTPTPGVNGTSIQKMENAPIVETMNDIHQLQVQEINSADFAKVSAQKGTVIIINCPYDGYSSENVKEFETHLKTVHKFNERQAHSLMRMYGVDYVQFGQMQKPTPDAVGFGNARTLALDTKGDTKQSVESPVTEQKIMEEKIMSETQTAPAAEDQITTQPEPPVAQAAPVLDEKKKTEDDKALDKKMKGKDMMDDMEDSEEDEEEEEGKASKKKKELYSAQALLKEKEALTKLKEEMTKLKEDWKMEQEKTQLAQEYAKLTQEMGMKEKDTTNLSVNELHLLIAALGEVKSTRTAETKGLVVNTAGAVKEDAWEAGYIVESLPNNPSKFALYHETLPQFKGDLRLQRKFQKGMV